jgi:hypothetical protein
MGFNSAFKVLIPYEQLFIQTFYHNRSLITEQGTDEHKPIISVGHRHHAYVSNHMKTKTDQHSTHNTLKSVPTLPR